MRERRTKLKILNSVIRTRSDFTVADLISWTGLTRSQIEPQVARLKRQGLLEDAKPEQRDRPPPRGSRGQPTKYYQLVKDAAKRKAVYTELAHIRKVVGLGELALPDLTRALELLGKLEEVLEFAEAHGATLSDSEYEQRVKQLNESEHGLQLAGMELDLDEDSTLRTRLIEAWDQKRRCADMLEKVRGIPGRPAIIHNASFPDASLLADADDFLKVFLTTPPQYTEPLIYLRGLPGTGKTEAVSSLIESLRLLFNTPAHDEISRGNIWDPLYRGVKSCSDPAAKTVFICFLDEAQDEWRTLQSMVGSNYELHWRDYALAKTTARYLPDPDLPLQLHDQARYRILQDISEVPFNQAIFRARAHRPPEEVYPFWEKAVSVSRVQHPVRLYVVALIEISRLNSQTWTTLENEAERYGRLSFVARREVGFIRRPYEVMTPRLENTISGPIEFHYAMQPSFCVYGTYKDILAQNAGFDYLQLATAMVTVGAPQKVAWEAAQSVDQQRGLLLIGSALADTSPSQNKHEAESFGKMLESDFGARVICLEDV